MGEGSVLSAEDLGLRYGARAIFSQLRLSLTPGEILCVLGPNGVGKSTLIGCLAGTMAPSTGRVRLDGQDMATLPRAAIARRLAIVPQVSDIAFAFTVLNVVEMGRAPHLPALLGMPGEKESALARAALDQLGIGHLAGARVTEISGGERQLVALARALTQEPAVLILDEPTAHLDFANQARFLDTAARLAAEGLAILFTTHTPDHAYAVADQTLLLTRDREPLAGPTADVLTSAALSRTFGLPIDVLQTCHGPVCVGHRPASTARLGQRRQASSECGARHDWS